MSKKPSKNLTRPGPIAFHGAKPSARVSGLAVCSRRRQSRTRRVCSIRAAEPHRQKWNLSGSSTLRKEQRRDLSMKLSFWSAMAAMLWAASVQAQVLQGQPGPASTAPMSPDERTPLTQPTHRLPSTTGMASGTPGPFLPNANNPTKSSPMLPSPGVFPSPPTGKQ